MTVRGCFQVLMVASVNDGIASPTMHIGVTLCVGVNSSLQTLRYVFFRIHFFYQPWLCMNWYWRTEIASYLNASVWQHGVLRRWCGRHLTESVWCSYQDCFLSGFSSHSFPEKCLLLVTTLDLRPKLPAEMNRRGLMS